MKQRFISFLIALLPILIFGFQSPYISLSKVTPEGGVAYSQVTSILEDNQGFIWFSTNNGLFTYNSVNIKRYSHLQNDSLTISTNRINQLYKDYSGKIWVATENGLCAYNSNKDTFKRYIFKDQFDNNIGKDISSFFQDNDGTFWFSDEKGIGTLNPKNGRAFYKNVNNKTSRVSCLSIDENNNIWAFYNDGDIYFLPNGSNTFQFFAKGLKNLVRSVYIDKNHIWIGYETKGLLCINITTREHEYIFDSLSLTKELKLPNNQVRSLIKDNKNRIWVGTYNGIAIIKDFKLEQIITEQKYSELPNHSIWALYKDSQNNIWIGTWMGGLAFHSNYNNAFLHYNQSTSKKSLTGNIVGSITQVPNKNELLIGLDDGNLNKYNLDDNLFSSVPVIYKKDTIQNIKSLAFDKHKTLWIGTYGNGILYQKNGEKQFKKLELPFENGFQALDILATDEGIWVSNYPLGVFFYNFETKKFTQYRHNPLNINSISSNNVHHIIEGSNGNIWFATQNGLNLLKKEESKFTHYFHQGNNPESISTNYIYSIHEDHNGYLWLGTNGQGLNKFNPKTGKTEHFTIKDGLSGNEIFSILQDTNNHLWLTTENGICKFNLDNNTIQSYATNKGIKNNHFNPSVALAATNGELFFGGSNGLVRFLPSRIIKNPIKPKTTVTSIYVNNKEILFKETGNLQLKHKQNSINFQFTSNNFINPQKNKFKYRLSGFNNDWVISDYTGKANYTNIPPGNYTFEVKAANNDGIWNETPTQIDLKITPPIWKRWYAYVLYTLLFATSVYFFRKQVINRQQLKSEINMAKIHRENEQQLHQMKLQFFTNISHEFRTPLTLIQGPVNRLLKMGNQNETYNKQLALIKNNTDRLLRLINQFLDFRRADSGKLKLTPIHTDIVSFCKNVFNCFEEHANHRGFTFNFETDVPNLKMDFDADKLDKVLVNIISNAFKYSDDNNKITVKILSNKKPNFNETWGSYTVGSNLEDDFVSVSIQDTGKGISADLLPKIFERFFQTEDNYNRGTGIGLSLSTNYISMHNGQLTVSSKEGEGSIFCICIPQKQIGTFNESSSNQHKVNSFDYSYETSNSSDIKITKEETVANQEALVLIAEDNPELLDFLGDTLQNHFRVAKAKNGKEAYTQMNSLYPDIVISDIMMPEMDGVELCNKIKNDIRTSHTPVILLTALDTVKDRLTGIHSGADVYMPKPFNDDILIAQINNLLNSRKTLRNLFSSHQKVWEEDIEVLDLDKKFLHKAISIVEENLSNSEFTVENLAEKLHLSRTHLHRKLTSLTDQSATEFIRSIRLKHAVNLMKEGNYLVNEIGYAVGFNSHNYFTKSFKKQYGKSPTEFIKENLDFNSPKS
ncbi:response regulator [Seonamhaeicola sp. NFXS20]|uniref:hybrid sensor histidine kinase/response regulator transcription factor n=1 Tax=Seonamhaeicola sp. NFXS20 TaxID=2816959 RepID=UPI003B8C331D